ncbi:hypothetical protein [Emticicia agri]|uniref:Uncharacterized protein n=1 Tax=Emticicia agri TaxID=2492393 RepID=A0A4Q5LVE7_9BACT|nr:hypothetical protein [Emticicia agri]RYU93711.1 hypothetical protein EWM59_20550 [Emticicia agri]
MPLSLTIVQTIYYIYRETIEDIENGINLSEHLQTISAGLEMINEQITLHRQEGKDIKGYEALKNQFCYLKGRIIAHNTNLKTLPCLPLN